MEPFITTFTGRKVNPLALRKEDICIEDIAHHLAHINRFVGALIQPVNVAAHSVFVSRLCADSGWEKEALFHDATEAYLGDVSKWVKQHPSMSFYRTAEAAAWLVICEALELRSHGAPEHNIIVEYADRLLVRYENLALSAAPHHMFEISARYTPPSEIECDKMRKVGWYHWDATVSEGLFLQEAQILGFKI
ncbi:MAG: hypothetical protein JW395_1059 [Nitrospira sp.]|nr:hypothetical protein [Nitrospira sp.]